MRPLILTGSSGVGKGTLLQRLIDNYPDSFFFSVSYTTRSKRVGEIEGKHYHFLPLEVFENAINENEFIEYTKIFDNYYGTHKDILKTIRSSNKICIFEVELSGVKALIEFEEFDEKPLIVLVLPPSIEHLKSRLQSRGSETEASISKRLEVAKKELVFAKSLPYNISLVNEDLNLCYQQLEAYLKSVYPILN